jgi:hypothetical protein
VKISFHNFRVKSSRQRNAKGTVETSPPTSEEMRILCEEVNPEESFFGLGGRGT